MSKKKKQQNKRAQRTSTPLPPLLPRRKVGLKVGLIFLCFVTLALFVATMRQASAQELADKPDAQPVNEVVRTAILAAMIALSVASGLAAAYLRWRKEHRR